MNGLSHAFPGESHRKLSRRIMCRKMNPTTWITAGRRHIKSNPITSLTEIGKKKKKNST